MNLEFIDPLPDFMATDLNGTNGKNVLIVVVVVVVVVVTVTGSVDNSSVTVSSFVDISGVVLNVIPMVDCSSVKVLVKLSVSMIIRKFIL